jgi:hypothetical protein
MTEEIKMERRCVSTLLSLILHKGEGGESSTLLLKGEKEDLKI